MRFYLSEQYENASDEEKRVIVNGAEAHERTVEAALRDAISEIETGDVDLFLQDRSIYAMTWKDNHKKPKVSIDDYSGDIRPTLVFTAFFAFLGVISLFISFAQAIALWIVAAILLTYAVLEYVDYFKKRRTLRPDTLINESMSYLGRKGFALTKNALYTAQVRLDNKDRIEVARIPYSEIQAVVVHRTKHGFVTVVFDGEGRWHEIREPKGEKVKCAQGLVDLIKERMKTAVKPFGGV